MSISPDQIMLDMLNKAVSSKFKNDCSVAYNESYIMCIKTLKFYCRVAGIELTIKHANNIIGHFSLNNEEGKNSHAYRNAATKVREALIELLRK